MIGMLRKNFGKRAIAIVAWMTVFSLGGIGLLGGLFKRFSGVPQTTIATVNGYEIGILEFQRKYLAREQQIQALRQRFGKAVDAELAKWGSARDQAFKELVMQKILLSAAEKMGIEVSPEYAAKKLQDPYFLMQTVGDLVPPQKLMRKGGPDYRELLKTIQKQGISPQCFENMVEQRLKGNALVDFAAVAGHVPEAAIREAFNAQFRGKKFEITKIPLSNYIQAAQKQGVTDEQLQAFFAEANESSRKYWKPEQRTGTVWTFENPSADFVKEAEAALDAGENDFASFVEKNKGAKSSVGPVERRFDAVNRKLYQLNVGAKLPFTEGQKGYIVELTNMIPSAEVPLNAIKSRVQEDYFKAEALNKLKQDLDNLQKLDRAERQAWIDSHKANNNITQEKTEFMSSDKQESWKNLQKEGIATYQLIPMGKVGQIETGITDKYGYLAELAELEPFNQELFNEKKKELSQGLSRDAQELVKAGFIASLEKNGKIDTNKSFFNKKS